MAGEVLVFDLETQKLADEVGGWGHIDRMGLAAAVTLNTGSGEFKHYLETDAPALLADLRAASLVVGFNLVRFDYEVLRPYGGADLPTRPTVDMLRHLSDALGFRVSLDSVAEATLGIRKAADGLQSVRWYKRGELEKVLDYCQQDVSLTHQVYQYGREHRHVKFRDRFGKARRVAVGW